LSIKEVLDWINNTQAKPADKPIKLSKLNWRSFIRLRFSARKKISPEKIHTEIRYVLLTAFAYTIRIVCRLIL